MSADQSMKQQIVKNLPPTTANRLRHARYGIETWWSHAGKGIQKWWFRNDLNRLATLFGSDKWGFHSYTPIYERRFRPLKSRHIKLLEIGVGGYQDVNTGGGSLRMWKSYFPNGQIVGIDLYDKSHMSEPRMEIRQCNQIDRKALTSLSEEYGGFDIVIDDGSHVCEHVITSFEILFHLLRPNGIYVVEDTQTSYWPSWGGGPNNPNTSVNYFKALVDGLNHAEFPVPDYQRTYWDRNIVEISFNHNLIFIQKGDNDEPTVFPDQIQQEAALLAKNNSL